MPYDKFEQAAPIERPEIITDNKLFEQALLQGMGDVRQAIEGAKQRKFLAAEEEKKRQQENKQKAFDLKVPSVGISGVDNAINENVYKAKESALSNNPEYFSYAKQAEKDKALGDAFNKSIEQIGTGLTNLEQKYGNAVVGKQKIADEIVNTRTKSKTPQEAAEGIDRANTMLEPINSVDFTAFFTESLGKDQNIKPKTIEYIQKKNGQDEIIKYTTSFPIKTDKPIQVYQNGRLVDKTDGSGNKIYQYRIPENLEDYIPFAKEYLGLTQQGQMPENTQYFGAQYYTKNKNQIDEEVNKSWELYNKNQKLSQIQTTQIPLAPTTQTPEAEEAAKKAFIDARRQSLIEDGITKQMAEIMRAFDMGRNTQSSISFTTPKAEKPTEGEIERRYTQKPTGENKEAANVFMRTKITKGGKTRLESIPTEAYRPIYGSATFANQNGENPDVVVGGTRVQNASTGKFIIVKGQTKGKLVKTSVVVYETNSNGEVFHAVIPQNKTPNEWLSELTPDEIKRRGIHIAPEAKVNISAGGLGEVGLEGNDLKEYNRLKEMPTLALSANDQQKLAKLQEKKEDKKITVTLPYKYVESYYRNIVGDKANEKNIIYNSLDDAQKADYEEGVRILQGKKQTPTSTTTKTTDNKGGGTNTKTKTVNSANSFLNKYKK